MSDARYLIVLRHAHASAGQIGQQDRDRGLSDIGEAEADAVAGFLAKHPRIARVVSSPAVRTKQTTERVLARLGYIDTRHDERIYEATPGQLIEVLEDHADVPVLLLVGHNPGLESLVALLSTGRTSEYRGMAPAGVAVLRLGSGALEPGSAELVEFWSP